MTGQTIVVCADCATAYSVRKRDDGTFVFTTDNGNCHCGSETFVEMGVRTITD